MTNKAGCFHYNSGSFNTVIDMVRVETDLSGNTGSGVILCN